MKGRMSRDLEFILILSAILAAGTFIFLTLKNSAPVFGAAAVFCAIAAFAVYAPEKARAAADLCFRFRWAIALLLFLLCLALRISGSSIGVYDEMLPTRIDQTESTWFGEPRWIRSDEYGVQTPTYFSQAYNGHALYSDRVSLSPTNMVLDYYSPVWDLTALGKPLMWGYLLFGNTVGLSWYWCGLILLLFMTALEMLMILTRGCRWISVLGAVLITLSPAVQWWVMPHMPIVILYAMALFCVGYYFFTAKKTGGRWGCAALAVITVPGYVLSLFPSFQVACGYAVIALLSVCLLRDRKKITFRLREWYCAAIPAAAALGILIRFFILSKDELSLLMNTVYPGQRAVYGGMNSIRDLFTDLTSLFLPYRDVNYKNNCEVSTYIHFAPLFMLLFPRIFVFLKRSRSADLWAGTALAALLALYALYMCVGIPPFLAGITLLEYCDRMKGVYGWLAALFTAWGIYVLAKHPGMLKKWQKILYPLLYGGVCFLLPDENTAGYFGSFGTLKGIPVGTVLLIGEIAVLTVLLLVIFFDRRRLTVCGLAVFMAVAGLGVNPIEHGTAAVWNHPISRSIAEISARDPDGLWLCTDCMFALPNFAAANGAKVLDATDFYPDAGKWKIIDPDGIFEEYTNRYANQTVFLSDGDGPTVELVAADCIYYTLTPDLLRQLGVRYLLSAADHSGLLDSCGIRCDLEMKQDGYRIYRLSY